MKTKIAEYVEGLTNDEREAIIKSFEAFEENGFIGEEPVRTYTRDFLRKLGIAHEYQISMWMTQMAMECFRFYYYNSVVITAKQKKEQHEHPAST